MLIGTRSTGSLQYIRKTHSELELDLGLSSTSLHDFLDTDV